jgi:UDP-N-acetyl-D-mannosaminuronic acid dehydrogenase
MKKICVIGLGYIGLPTSAMFAQAGIEVIGVDVNEKAVELLNQGQIHIEEPGLGDIIKDVVANGKFKAKLEAEEADAFIIAVPTPNKDDEHKSCDLSYVETGVRSVMPYIKKGNAIIVESTIGPRTIDDFVKPIVEEKGFTIGEDVYLAHCPERVLPGQIIREMVENNRIVGGYTAKCAEVVSNLYRAFVKGEIVKTNAKTAEMSKLMENTFRDVNIALANELAKVCNKLEINVLDVIEMANKHPRVNIHQPGPGVGGHCLAVDPYFIVEKAPELARIISLARETNCSMPKYVVEETIEMLKGVKNPKIAALGITYKGNIDDMRESPAMDIIEMLQEKGYEVAIHDPHVVTDKLNLISLEESLEGADIGLILADHSEFKELDLAKLAKLMRTPLMFDTKNILKGAVEKNKDLLHQDNTEITIKNMGNIFEV